jgi:hypothetical protein
MDPDVAGKTGIEVEIDPDDGANTVASNTQSDIAAIGDFSGSGVSLNVVTVTNSATGNVPDAADVNAGVTINVVQHGDATGQVGYYGWYDVDNSDSDPLPWHTEMTEIDFTGATPAGLDGTYFTLESLYSDYYIWFDLDDLSIDPAPALRTGIEVDIATGDSVSDMASKFVTEVDANDEFFSEVKPGFPNVVRLWNEELPSEIPTTMIGFFSSTPSDPWKVMNGVDATPDVIGMYPRGYNAEGSAAGSNTHSHSSEAMGNTGIANQRFAGYGLTHLNTMDANHTHTQGSHGHGSGNHEPPYYTLIPAVSATPTGLPAGTMLYYDGAVAPVGWTAWAAIYDTFIKFDTTAGGTGGATSHTHPTWSGTSGASSGLDQERDSNLNDVSLNASHTHSISHSHSGGNNYPEWHGLLPITNDAEVFSVPSGVIAFFTGSVVPDGWKVCDGTLGTPDLQSKFPQCKSTNGGTGGANSHSHGHGMASGSWSGTYNNGGHAGSSGQITRYSHNHSLQGTHSAVADNNLIYHKPLLVCKKD